jgi:hypothetical protein
VSVLAGGCFDSKRAVRPRRPQPAQAAEVSVVRIWSILLDDGLVDQAADQFRIPAVVQNGGRPRRLTSYRAVRAFNASLPCGARLARTFARGRYVVAVFALTDRPGHGCGTDYGHEAATEFLIEGGRIAEWRALDERIPDD